MNIQLKKSLDDFFIRAKGTKSEGKIVDKEILTELNNNLGGLLPDWFINMLLTYPLTGAELDFPLYDPSEDYDGLTSLQIADSADIFNESSECYPGIAIKELGYFCFGTDLTGGGNPFFIQNNKGENPQVFQVYHDVSDEGEEIEKEGMVKIADSLSEFFDKSIVVK